MKYKISGIILAAGNGKRFGLKKQFKSFLGRQVWKWSYEVAKSVLDEVVVVGVDFNGGKTRQKSVKIGLKHVTGDKVIIFDAARPLVTEKQILAIKKAVSVWDSVSFATRPTDTIYCRRKYFRENALSLQVPQAFDTNLLRLAHKKTKRRNATDDTILMLEEFGIEPMFIEGGKNLHKLTYQEDIKILKILYEDINHRRR